MKIAIILSGNIRTWEHCKKSYLETFNKLNTDIFISTYDRQYDYHPYIVKHELKNFNENILDVDKIKSMFGDLNLKSIDIEKAEDVDSFVNQERTLFNPKMLNIESCYKQFRKIKLCIDSVVKHEKENSFKYDIIIKLRFDNIFNHIVHILPNNKEIIINDNGDLPNDWVISSHRDNFIKTIDFMMNEFYEPKFKNSSDSPPHQLFKNAIDSNNLIIVKKPICKKILRIDEV